ncbi:MAG: NAD(P)-dependent glycerol-3-phosphate dehydrogenase [Deltaproteobacteria bacterium]|nr:NAD(P)-dependent glycerol-3-phosphate dehydrogenase [Deltaproteobacteria bacterium]
MENVAIVGAGSWGTTLANLLAQKGVGRVRLWARSPGITELIKKTRENVPYLPGVRLSGNLFATSSLQDALKGASIAVCAVPSHGVREVFKEASRHISGGCLIVNASKGIEEKTLLTCSGILREVLGDALNARGIVVMSGPTFAKEVSRGLPAAACAASGSEKDARAVQDVFSTACFRVYTNPDPIGVELGGALKNVIAIASGISDGLNLGANARAALITRGLAEMARLGVRMKASPGTFYGLSGLGDLVLTSTGELSRNRMVGLEIGRGRGLKDILSGMNMVAEGVKTAMAVMELARRHCVEMPISEGVYKVLYDGKPPREAVMELMTRGLKGEM